MCLHIIFFNKRMGYRQGAIKDADLNFFEQYFLNFHWVKAMASHISVIVMNSFSTCSLILVFQRFCARVNWEFSMKNGQCIEKASDVLATLCGDQCTGHVYSFLISTWKYWKKLYHVSENIAILFGNSAEGASFVWKEQTARKITRVQLF